LEKKVFDAWQLAEPNLKKRQHVALPEPHFPKKSLVDAWQLVRRLPAAS
jgi:hypothetical protein